MNVYLPIVNQEIAVASPVYEMFTLIAANSDQQHPMLAWNETLAKVAESHARDMAARGYVSHTNQAGYGSNRRAEFGGYALPPHYGQEATANNIESIAVGFRTPQLALAGLAKSPGHWAHLMGLDPFFREQYEVGIGWVYARGQGYYFYCVILIARPAVAVSASSVTADTSSGERILISND